MLLIVCICLIPLILPVYSLWVKARGQVGFLGGASGGMPLSLPIPVAGESTVLAGWDDLCLPAAEAVLSESFPDTPGAFSPPGDPLPEGSGDEPFHVEFHGYLDEGNLKVYCFFDTKNNRWFRLSVGQLDDTSGIRLERSSDADIPFIVNTRNGCRYVYQSDLPGVVPFHPGDPFPDEL